MSPSIRNCARCGKDYVNPDAEKIYCGECRSQAALHAAGERAGTRECAECSEVFYSGTSTITRCYRCRRKNRTPIVYCKVCSIHIVPTDELPDVCNPCNVTEKLNRRVTETIEQPKSKRLDRCSCGKPIVTTTDTEVGKCLMCRNQWIRASVDGDKYGVISACKLGIDGVIRYAQYSRVWQEGMEVWVNGYRILPEQYDSVTLTVTDTIILKCPDKTNPYIDNSQESSLMSREYSQEAVAAEVSKAREAYDQAVAATTEYNNTLTENLQEQVAKAFNPEVQKYTTAAGREVDFINSTPQLRLTEVQQAFPTVTLFVNDSWIDNWERKLDALEGETIKLDDREWDNLRAQVDNLVQQATSHTAGLGAA